MFHLRRLGADCRAGERCERDPEMPAEHPFHMMKTMRLLEESSVTLVRGRRTVAHDGDSP